MRGPDVPHVRGLPSCRQPAALPAELPLRRVLLLGRSRVPVRRPGQLCRSLRGERRARRVARAWPLRCVPSLPAALRAAPQILCVNACFSKPFLCIISCGKRALGIVANVGGRGGTVYLYPPFPSTSQQDRRRGLADDSGLFQNYNGNQGDDFLTPLFHEDKLTPPTWRPRTWGSLQSLGFLWLLPPTVHSAHVGSDCGASESQIPLGPRIS